MSEQLVGRDDADRFPRLLGSAEFDALDALGALGTGIVGVSAEWKIAFANRAWAALVGARIEDYLGRDLWKSFPALAGTREEEAIRATMADGRPRAYRVDRGEERAGAMYDVRVTRTARGSLVFAFDDVAAAARRERELAERGAESESLRDLARQMAEVADTGALLNVLCGAAARQCDAAGVAAIKIVGDEALVVAAVGSVEHVAGSRFPLAGSLAEVALGSRCTVVDPAYAAHHPNFRRVAAEYGVGAVMAAPLVAQERRLGALFVARAEGAPEFTARDEQRLQVIADHASLTLWKARLFEEAQAASQAKSNFLTTMSHELRTPLTALTGYGELLADEIMGPMSRPQHEVIERMRSVTHHLAVMIDEILTFSSIEAGRETVRAAEVDGAALLRAAMAVVEPLARQKGIDFVATIEGGVPPLFTDPDKVRQILVNLAGNAIKFTDVGSVGLGFERRGEREVRFLVRDTGIGISEEDLARLFQPFIQVDTGLTRRHGGTGLGLYISSRLAELLGGRIEVESTPGAGSVFALVIPTRNEKG